MTQIENMIVHKDKRVCALITRPAPDDAALAAQLEALGFETLCSPLFDTVFAGGPPLLAGANALVATSRNALRALARHGPFEEALLRTPFFAVGEETAAAAHSAGFSTVHAAAGDVESLIPLLNDACADKAASLLYLAGKKRKPDLENALAGYHLRVWEGYDMQAAPALSAQACIALERRTVDVVLLYSAYAAQHYVRLTATLGPAALEHPLYACLSPAVESLPRTAGWKTCAPATPSTAALLDLLVNARALAQTRAS